MNNKALLESKLKDIYDVLKNSGTNEKHHGVLSGSSGISLFQFYYSRLIDAEEPADLGVTTLSKIINEINNGYTYPTFCTGIAGAGWVLELLNEEEFIDIDSDELLSDLDEYLFVSMKANTDEGYYDFLHGAIGYGCYFLKRYQNTQNTQLKTRYKDYLHYLVTALKKSALQDQAGTYWKTMLDHEKKMVGVNLSLSHGLASIINFLSRIYAFDDFKDEVKEVLIQTVEYIQHQKCYDSSSTSMFPTWIYEGMDKVPKARLAWCYGDLGLGLSLWKAGKALDNSSYKKEALTILRNAATRKDRIEAGVKDVGLCHGSCGIAHIFHFMYKETQEPIFKVVAHHWMDQAVTMATHNGNAGYMQWGGEKEQWKEETNLLEGIAGIGLAMISFLADFETKWDECLLIH
ncbi:lanthionine synthetase C family protein [Aquimarina sp. U1-2]|uniref:lanthionine synthetase C family protein n=1 Tax=Aquimarina sp. U1-2 TaxID=2823141 RepID=UPI001AEC9574|nr:lanthionine synthetase C family protein [Aquimarina sp. U1-2]MBP2834103.1 lanthionine synthetase C family protein [Aquimarina sp. U1-2]